MGILWNYLSLNPIVQGRVVDMCDVSKVQTKNTSLPKSLGKVTSNQICNILCQKIQYFCFTLLSPTILKLYQ
mgnify:CR=1 FL=1